MFIKNYKLVYIYFSYYITFAFYFIFKNLSSYHNYNLKRSFNSSHAYSGWVEAQKSRETKNINKVWNIHSFIKYVIFSSFNTTFCEVLYHLCFFRNSKSSKNYFRITFKKNRKLLIFNSFLKVFFMTTLHINIH